jgi:hypothetical protein
LPWMKYCDLISEIDLAISLMDAPHPSYPPLEFAASGAVVLTNTAPGKEKLHYSKNIIMRAPDMNSLLDGLDEAIKLVNNPAQRLKNFEKNEIAREWAQSFKEPINKSKELLNLN